MTLPAYLSPLQFEHHPDGRITLQGFPNVTLETIQAQGTVTGRDWQKELEFPHYHDDWEILGMVRRETSGRYLRFVLLDESITTLPGNPRFNPQGIAVPGICPLTISHTGFIVGFVYMFHGLFNEEQRATCAVLGIDLPDFPEGRWIMGQAELFDSRLAEKCWRGLQGPEPILSHVCPVVFRTPEQPIGTGTLVEVSLTPGDYPGCQNARVLKTWER